MRGMLGCAGMIAGFGFVLGAIGACFAPLATLGEKLLVATMTGGFAFIAALVLIARDYLRHKSTVGYVQYLLLARNDVSDQDFAAHFPDIDSTLIVQIRQAISQFFDVPVAKIHPTDNLHKDFFFRTLEPTFYMFVLYRILGVRNVEPQSYTFSTANLVDIGDLAKEIQRVLDANSTSKRRGNGLT